MTGSEDVPRLPEIGLRCRAVARVMDYVLVRGLLFVVTGTHACRRELQGARRLREISRGLSGAGTYAHGLGGRPGDDPSPKLLPRLRVRACSPARARRPCWPKGQPGSARAPRFQKGQLASGSLRDRSAVRCFLPQVSALWGASAALVAPNCQMGHSKASGPASGHGGE